MKMIHFSNANVDRIDRLKSSWEGELVQLKMGRLHATPKCKTTDAHRRNGFALEEI